MIVLDKKKIMIMVFIVILLLIIESFLFAIEDENQFQTVSWQVNSKAIILDAGHGLPDKRCCTGKIM